MKIFGGSRKKKHLAGHHIDSGGKTAAVKNRRDKKAENDSRKRVKKLLKTLIILLSVVLVLLIAVFAAVKFFIKPPEVGDSRSGLWGGRNTGDGEATRPGTEGSGSQEERSQGIFTFLIIGTDNGFGNTDTIMVAAFDTDNYELNVVSIPRDTLVNVSWSVKKVNSLYGVGGAERSMEGISKILGFKPDFYLEISLKAFEKLVDAVGGIYYDVPRDMKYSDPAQDLYINISKGYQKLDGESALKVMRFRSGYSDADIGRIGTQQDFLKTAAGQIMTNMDSLNIMQIVEIFNEYVKTDLTYGEIMWLAKEFHKLDQEKLHFMTLPGNYGDTCYHGGQWVSYVTIYVDEWLEMVNEYLNPYSEKITADDVDIYTRNSSGRLYTTSGVFAGNSAWGYPPSSSSGGSSSGSTSPSTGGTGNTGSGTSGTGSETADPTETTDPPETVPETPPEDPGEGGETVPETPPEESGGEGPETGGTSANELFAEEQAA